MEKPDQADQQEEIAGAERNPESSVNSGIPLLSVGERESDKAQEPQPAAEVPAKPKSDNAKPEQRIKQLEFDIPEKVGKYTIGDKLGSGTCGIVFKAHDEVLNRLVAIKLSPMGKPDVSTGKVPGAQRAFMTEISAAGRLKHANIVTVYDAGQFESLNYLVMEYVAGYSLKMVGKGQKLLPPHRAVEVIVECCNALDYAHSRNIVHRDIKPANIMLGKDGAVKLLDFGIALSTSAEDNLTKAGPTLGTPNYMSPEQIRGRPLGPASDFYSLVTVLFELLTGKQLFKAKKVKDLFRIVVGEVAPTLSDIRPDLPRELSDVVAKALHKDPVKRFQSGDELVDALAPIAEQMRIMAKRSEQQLSLIRQLRQVGFFSDFSESEVAVFLNHAELLECHNGDLLLKQGESSRKFSVIVDGVVTVRKDGHILSVLGAGDTFGELGFIHKDPSPVQVEAQYGVTIVSVTPTFLAKLSPKIHLRFYKRISESFVESMTDKADRVVDLLLDD